MIESPPLDIANLISILKCKNKYSLKLFDYRIHSIKNDSFFKEQKIDVNLFADFSKCFTHMLITEYSEISRILKTVLKNTELKNIDFMIFSISLLEQFSLKYLVPSLCVAYQLKKVNKKIKTILFGTYPKIHSRKIIENFKFVDAILEDGNEFSVLEYIKNFRKYKPIDGINYRNKDKLIYSPRNRPLKLNNYPIPDFSFLNLKKYKSNGKLVLPYEISRGCINNCFFCYYIHKGGKISKKNYKKAVNELIYLKNNYNTNKFHFMDAEINFNISFLKNFCQELILKKAQIFWSALAIPTGLNYSLLKLMRESGCVQLRFGVESGSGKLLRVIDKKTNLPEMSRILKDTYRAGIYTYMTLINGLPIEERADIIKTKNFLRKNKKYINSAYVCTYGELGHFDIKILDNLLNNKETEGREASERWNELVRKMLEVFIKKLGIKREDIIDGFPIKA